MLAGLASGDGVSPHPGGAKQASSSLITGALGAGFPTRSRSRERVGVCRRDACLHQRPDMRGARRLTRRDSRAQVVSVYVARIRNVLVHRPIFPRTVLARIAARCLACAHLIDSLACPTTQSADSATRASQLGAKALNVPSRAQRLRRRAPAPSTDDGGGSGPSRSASGLPCRTSDALAGGTRLTVRSMTRCACGMHRGPLSPDVRAGSSPPPRAMPIRIVHTPVRHSRLQLASPRCMIASSTRTHTFCFPSLAVLFIRSGRPAVMFITRSRLPLARGRTMRPS